MLWKKSNHPCIPHGRARNLDAMVSNEVAHAEQGAWKEVAPGWRQLYGDFDRLGLSIEWHDFRTRRALDWGRSFHPRSLEFCLNLNGRGAVGAAGQARSDYLPGNSGYYAIADEPLPASRRAHDHHQFVTLEFSREHLQKQLVQNEADLESDIRQIVFDGKKESVIAPARPMTVEQRGVVASLERTKELLARDLANPPTLEMLGHEVGCSPFYLSRIFSREVGLTIPQYLRNLRMERAAELLRTGRYNVTEAATEVGYSSLSHFSKAFCETIGCCPVLYPAAKNVILDR